MRNPKAQRRGRLALALGVALACHLGLLAVPAGWRWRGATPPPETRVRVELVQAFELRPAQPVAPPVLPEPTASLPLESAPPPPVSAGPAPPEPSTGPSPPPAPALDVLVRQAAEALGTEPPPAPAARVLGRGRTEGPTVAQLLDAPPPPLPGAAGEMALTFYSGGVHGDMQRLGDALSPEFGFRVPGLIEVRCKFMVVVFACAW